MKRLWHPSKRRLQAWLEHGDDELDEHLGTCERCATRLEDLSQPETAIRDALREMLRPPEDLQPRLRAGVARKMQTREDMKLLVELLGVPWQTARAMSTDPPQSNEDR